MPPVIAGALVAGAASVGVTLGTTTATILAYGITTAATLGATFLLGQPKKQKGDPQQVTPPAPPLPCRRSPSPGGLPTS